MPTASARCAGIGSAVIKSSLTTWSGSRAKKYWIPDAEYGKTESGRSHGEGRRLVGHHQVAVEHQVAGTAPHRAVHHGDDGARVGAYRAQQLLERIGEGQRVDTPHGQLVDVVPGRPHRAGRRRAQHHRPHTVTLEGSERLEHRRHGAGAQGVAPAGVVESQGADPVLDADPDDRGRGPTRSGWRRCRGLVRSRAFLGTRALGPAGLRCRLPRLETVTQQLLSTGSRGYPRTRNCPARARSL